MEASPGAGGLCYGGGDAAAPDGPGCLARGVAAILPLTGMAADILAAMNVTDLLQPQILMLAPLIVYGAYVVFGISGFGSTLIAVPLLAHLMPLKFVVPFFVILDCVGAANLGLRLRGSVMKRELIGLMPFMALGILGGVWLLVLSGCSLLVRALA